MKIKALKILSIILVASFIFLLGSCGENESVNYINEPIIQNIPTESTTIEQPIYYSLLYSGTEFNNNVAWVRYENKSSENCYSLIDKSGNKIYTYIGENAHIGSNDGLNYIGTYNNYIVIDNTGKEIISSKENDFSAVLACGDDIILVCKYLGSIDSEKFLIGAFDRSGKQIDNFFDATKLIPSRTIEFLKNNAGPSSRYINNNVFEISFKTGDYGDNRAHSFLYNWKTQTMYDTKTSTVSSFAHNTLCIKSTGDGGGTYIQVLNPSLNSNIYGAKTRYEKNDLCGINISSTYGFMTFSSQNMVLHFAEYDKTTYLINCTQMKKHPINVHNCKSIEDFNFCNKYGAISLKGQDGNKYLELIDELGNEICEPISYIRTYKISDEAIILDTSIYDLNGNLIAANIPVEEFLTPFHEGLALAKTADHNVCYINTNGEIVLNQINT